MELQKENEVTGDAPALFISPSIMGWGIAAIIASCVMLTFNTSTMVVGAGLFAKIIAGVLGSALGVTGALVGDMLRLSLRPNIVFTSGGIYSLFSTKLFWLLGLQLLGLFIGVALGCSLVLG
ncbi:hypothetical protein [Onishia niordana]|uniref:hypothetical protein n=1 Tax=Onishia niordana TaxID=2508711 RepID=UPI00197AE81D|nr:hypothetical protein [Halomonas niordiana]